MGEAIAKKGASRIDSRAPPWAEGGIGMMQCCVVSERPLHGLSSLVYRNNGYSSRRQLDNGRPFLACLRGVARKNSATVIAKSRLLRTENTTSLAGTCSLRGVGGGGLSRLRVVRRAGPTYGAGQQNRRSTTTLVTCQVAGAGTLNGGWDFNVPLSKGVALLLLACCMALAVSRLHSWFIHAFCSRESVNDHLVTIAGLVADASILQKVRATCFYATTFVIAAPLFIVMLILHPFVLLFDKERRKLHHLVNKVWARMTTFLFYHTEIVGWENLPSADEGVVYVANHQSFLDIYTLFQLGRPFKFISKISNFVIPIIGWAMYLTGHIPLKREDQKSQLVSEPLSESQAGRCYSIVCSQSLLWNVDTLRAAVAD